MSSYLNETQIDEYSNTIKNDIIWYKLQINQTAESSLIRKGLFNSYFREMLDNNYNKCPLPTKPFENNTIDFFKFIQFGGDIAHNQSSPDSAADHYNLKR